MASDDFCSSITTPYDVISPGTTRQQASSRPASLLHQIQLNKQRTLPPAAQNFQATATSDDEPTQGHRVPA